MREASLVAARYLSIDELLNQSVVGLRFPQTVSAVLTAPSRFAVMDMSVFDDLSGLPLRTVH